MSASSDKSESSLELLIKELETSVKNIITNFNEGEIALCSGKLKPIKTMLENRKERSDLLDNLENHKDTTINEFYFDQKLREVNQDDFKNLTTNQAICSYFEKEIERVSLIRDKLISRCSDIDVVNEIEPQFSTLLQSITEHIATCQNTVNEFKASSMASYTYDDLILLIKGRFVKHQREIFIKQLLDETKMLIFSKRSSIILDCFDLIEKDLMETNKSLLPIVPFLVADAPLFDDELVKIGLTFDVHEDINIQDSQRFIYVCDKKFTEIWNKLETFSVDIKEDKIKPKILPRAVEELCNQAHINEVPIEEELNSEWERIISSDFQKILSNIKEDASNYNALVNGKDYLKQTLLNMKPPIQVDKIIMFMKLRVCKAKYLILMIMSHLNFFQAVKQNIYGANYQWRESKFIKNMIEVIDEDGTPVFLQSAKEEFDKIQKTILQVVSYYITSYNAKTVDKKDNDNKIIDKQQMLCNMLQAELNFLNDKRKLIQPLYECFYFDRTDETVEIIHKLIESRPIMNINIFNSCDYGYKLASAKLKIQADVINLVLKIEICHERHIAATIDKSVPLFDRVCDYPAPKALFSESIPISPLEHFSFSKIPKLLTLSDLMCLELAENIDLKTLQFMDYLKVSFWRALFDKISQLIQCIPFCYQSYPFKNELSTQVYSIIVSPFLNDLTRVIKFINNVPLARKLRFSLNFLVFQKICWKLQQQIIQADILQDVYISQSSRCGFSDAKIFMQPFSENATSEVIDINETYTSERILELGYVDFDHIDLDFCNPKSVKVMIDKGTFEELKEIFTFQKAHLFQLDVAVRYNGLLLDNDLVVGHFGLALEENTDFFLTAADATNPTSNQQDANFLRSFLVPTILLDAQHIFENYKKAQDNREWYFVNIRTLKREIRLILNAQAKQQTVNYDTYLMEMLEAFSGMAYRMEVAHVCRLERQLLLLNSFCDAFILDSTSILLVTESGRAQNHFVIPTWAVIFRYCRSAPLQRQATIFKTVLSHVVFLYRFLQLVRFECSLTQETEKCMLDLSNGEFKMETAAPQRLYNEIQRVPGGQEYEICSRFVQDKCKYYELRLELAILNSYDASFLSVESSEIKLRSSMLHLYHSIFEPPLSTGMSFKRYAPEWTTHFFSDADEPTRNDLARRMTHVDQKVENSLSQRQIHAALESSHAVSESIDFLLTCLAHMKFKYTYFNLFNKVFDVEHPFDIMTQENFNRANDIYNHNVVQEAHKLMAPKEDESSLFLVKQQTVTEDRVIAAQIEAMRNECDSILLAKQISDTKAQKEEIPSILQTEKEVSRPDPELLTFSSQPKEVDSFFTDDLKGCRAELVHLVGSIVRQSSTEDNDQETEKEANTENGALFSINFEKLENLAKMVTTIMNNFENESFKQHTSVWHCVLTYWLNLYREDKETSFILSIFEKMIKERFTNTLKAEIGVILYPYLLQINSITHQIKERKKAIIFEDIESERDINEEYKNLIYDLRNYKERIQKRFVQTREELYDHVQERIKKAAETQFDLKHNFVRTESKMRFDLGNSKKEEEIEFLKKKIKVMRIIRTMSNIATKRFFIKRIQTNEMDSKYESAKLWESRREFEVSEGNTLAELKVSYQKLADSEIEIERTRQMLDNEKQNTIQLVHWKATNQKREVELEEELKKFVGVDDIDVGELVKKVNKAKSTLEKLKKDTEELDVIHERDIKRPMTSIERTRKKITNTIIERTNFLQPRTAAQSRQTSFVSKTRTPTTSTLLNGTGVDIITSASEENASLQARNESLKKQIEELELAKRSLPKEVIAAIEEIKPSPRVTNTKKTKTRAPLYVTKSPRTPKAITRPVTAMTQQKQQVPQIQLKPSQTALQRKRGDTKFTFV